MPSQPLLKTSTRATSTLTSFLQTLPPHSTALKQAKALLIYTSFRLATGHTSFSYGTGLVLARRNDNTWSPPSLVTLTSLGTGFVFGVDKSEGLCILTSPDQVEALTKTRLSLGADISLSAFKHGEGRAVDAALPPPGAAVEPTWSYVKTKGLFVGVQIDGLAVLSRTKDNAAIYGPDVSVRDIFMGDFAWPEEAKPLFEALRAAEDAMTLPGAPAAAGGQMTPRDDVPPVAKYRDEEDDYENVQVDKKQILASEPPVYETAEEEKKRLAASGY